MKRPPTDHELLKAIYDRHQGEYVSEPANRAAAIFVPIDIPAIAAELGVEANSVFGRLYYHLEEIYGQEDTPHAKKSLFAPVVGDDRNCINFPLLEAVLAGLWQQRRRDLWTFWVAAISVGIAVGSLLLSILVASGVIG